LSAMTIPRPSSATTSIGPNTNHMCMRATRAGRNGNTRQSVGPGRVHISPRACCADVTHQRGDACRVAPRVRFTM
jgi:hypothetical protein